MYNVEDAKVACAESSTVLEMKIKRNITDGYMPKSISQGNVIGELCALLVKIKGEMSGTFDVEGKGTIGIEGSFRKKMK